jgi:hypothetical protein
MPFYLRGLGGSLPLMHKIYEEFKNLTEVTRLYGVDLRNKTFYMEASQF